jgi:hypothetical protein
LLKGYLIPLRRTRPKEVIECTWERFSLLRSSTRIPSTVTASAMRERWQRQGTASAHINALRFCPANLISLCNLHRRAQLVVGAVIALSRLLLVGESTQINLQIAAGVSRLPVDLG